MQSDFYGEHNATENYFSFEEDNDVDELERQLQELCDENEINGRFEAE